VRLLGGALLVVVGLVLAAPHVVELRAAAAEGARSGLLVLAGAVQVALAAAWFLTDRMAELWALAARAWPLLLAAAGFRILWTAFAGGRGPNGEANGSPS
jgi:hypothetical protein